MILNMREKKSIRVKSHKIHFRIRFVENSNTRDINKYKL